MNEGQQMVGGDYIVVKAMQDGVSIVGITRGRESRLHHTEKLDKGEVVIAQFTENTAAIKVRGNAVIQTRHGEIWSE